MSFFSSWGIRTLPLLQEISNSFFPLPLTLRVSARLCKSDISYSFYRSFHYTYKYSSKPMEHEDAGTFRGGSVDNAEASKLHELTIAIGSNEGGENRIKNVEEAVSLLQQKVGRIVDFSCLYQTVAAYVELGSQPLYLNAAVRMMTSISSPWRILSILKSIETDLGRADVSQREKNASRTIDLDILFFDDFVIEDEGEPSLTIPHPRISERNFVLYPLCDMIPEYVHPIHKKTLQTLLDENKQLSSIMEKDTKDGRVLVPERCMPIGDEIWSLDKRNTRIVGIVNTSPNSFYDKGRIDDEGEAVEHALSLIKAGADIIDIGAFSSAPGREIPDEDVQLQRVLPVIEAIRAVSNIPLSIDTMSARVFKEAHAAGANILNDISGAAYDPKMPEILKELGATSILMHMQGTPKTMDEYTDYENITSEISDFLKNRILSLQNVGIPRWRMIADAGLGFSKTARQNFRLLREVGRIRKILPRGIPLFLGFSHKRFIGWALNHDNFQHGGSLYESGSPEAQERVIGGAAIVSWCYLNDVEFLRTHDVTEAKCVVDVLSIIEKRGDKTML